MIKTKIIKNGDDQVLIIPKEYEFNCTEVTFNKIGEAIIIAPKDSDYDLFKKALEMFSDDYFDGVR